MATRSEKSREQAVTERKTADRLPARRRGGQELPDHVQDRPEQNAGYDAAVRGTSSARPQEPADDLGIDPTAPDPGVTIRDTPDGDTGNEER